MSKLANVIDVNKRVNKIYFIIIPSLLALNVEVCLCFVLGDVKIKLFRQLVKIMRYKMKNEKVFSQKYFLFHPGSSTFWIEMLLYFCRFLEHLPLIREEFCRFHSCREGHYTAPKVVLDA